jgi:hypothetical protein
MGPVFRVHSSVHVSYRGKCFGNGKGCRVAARGDALLYASIHPPPSSSCSRRVFAPLRVWLLHVVGCWICDSGYVILCQIIFRKGRCNL